ncbi:MAG: NFACT family protein [Clostridia bacterium]|nr:NFACT family protein [Clostridia bacterium]
MPMDGVTIKLITDELHRMLAGGRVDKITQPERDEVIITVRNNGENYPLLISASAGCARSHITSIKKNNPLEPPNLCMLMRKHLLGGRVSSIRQIDSDRIIRIDIEHTDELGDRAFKSIVLECMGKHSNIIFINGDGKIMESARRVTENISSYREVLPGLMYLSPPPHSKIPFDKAEKEDIERALALRQGLLSRALSDTVSGLSSPLAKELSYIAAGDETAGLEGKDISLIAERVSDALKHILSNPAPRVILNGKGETADFLAFEYKSRENVPFRAYSTLSGAIDSFYHLRDLEERISQKSAAIHRTLKNNLERAEKKIALQEEALTLGARMEEYRIKGELLSASPHLVKKGMKSVSLPNYYDENCAMLTVELDEKLSATANAQRYFKLYKKAQSARKLALEQKALAQEELLYLEGLMENLSKCTDESSLYELRDELIKQGYVKDTSTRRQTKSLPPSEPMKYVSADGTEILVGKNNLQNEKLTFSAMPNEWWLHVKDAPGSHVIVKSENPTNETMLFAAKLAAKHSKYSLSSNVAVDYTMRKYVKKPSGSKPGFVIYTHQRTVFVTPDP